MIPLLSFQNILRHIPTLIFLIPAFLSTGCLEQVASRDTSNRISILSVTPDTGLIDGNEILFSVKGNYLLESHSSATILLGFNNGDYPGEYIMVKDTVIQKGAGSFSFRVPARVKEWGTPGIFAAYVNISPYPVPTTQWVPYASDTYRIVPH